MATSPNYNWPEPDNTDLVKNGALAIRTAVNAIDTSLAELKGGTTGQVLSKTSNTDMDFTWVAQDDSNAIQNSIVDAKGDLIAATANDTPARLAVGANGTTLVADSTAATGLKWAVSPNFVGASVYATTNQSIANATGTFITFGSENFDSSSFHSTSSNTSRLTIPAGLGGYYRVSGSVRMNPSAVGRRLLQLSFNGASNIKAFEATPNATGEVSTSINAIVQLSVADYVELSMYQDTGGALSTVGTQQSTFFEIEYLGA